MKTIKLLITLVLLGLSYNSFAQCAYGIPPPCVPANDPGWGGGGGGGTQTRQPYWVYTWGALAKEMGGGPLGVSTGEDTKRKAEIAAIKDCQARGGKDCKKIFAYHHQCVVVASGKGVSWGGGPDLEETKQRILKLCNENKGEGECHIYYSNCTKPYLVE